MTPTPRRRTQYGARSVVGTVLLTVAALLAIPVFAYAAPTARINGSGSSWAGNAVNQWVADVKTQGLTTDYSADGSSTGRKNFSTGLADFAVSEIPYRGDTADPQETNAPSFAYGMLPAVAGGTAFMYNLNVGGRRLTTLKLSQKAVAMIFSGQVTRWDDPSIKASNPDIVLPAQRITVVVRSDGSGSTAQLTKWMIDNYPAQYAALCKVTGCNPTRPTSFFPKQGLSNFVAQAQSTGVTNYTANTPYTINYDEYSYAQNIGFPVAALQNAAGYYIYPTQYGVAVALTQAKINLDKSSPNYLSQDLSKVYGYKDPRTYAMSAYSYFIVPHTLHGNFSEAKGASLGYFTTYSLCQGQQTMGSLGYSPLPMNLVLAAMDQVLKIPGVDADTRTKIAATKSSAAAGNGNPCGNPTFKPGDTPSRNQLVLKAPFPAGCAAGCSRPWSGVDSGINTGPPVKNAPQGAANDAPGTGPGVRSGAGPGTTAAGPGRGTGAGAATGGGAAPGAPTGTDPSAAATLPNGQPAPLPGQVCDPETGTGCAETANILASGPISAKPTILSSSAGWGKPQNLMALAATTLLGLTIAPPLLAGRLGALGALGRSARRRGEQ